MQLNSQTEDMYEKWERQEAFYFLCRHQYVFNISRTPQTPARKNFLWKLHHVGMSYFWLNLYPLSPSCRVWGGMNLSCF